MTNLAIIGASVLLSLLLGDWYHQKRCDWDDWKRETWKPRHPSSRSKT